MPKAHVIYTGGTIGAQAHSGTIDLLDAPPLSLLDFAQQQHPDWELSTSEPFRILSENADPSHWETLGRHIASLPIHQLDAIFVCHGSDTLAWTASALSFLLAGIPIPVVLVAANYPLAHPDSNGLRNFSGALHFCEKEALPGVFVVWGNISEPVHVHLGVRIQSADLYTDAFQSVSGVPFAVLEADRCSRISHRLNPTRSSISELANSIRWKISLRNLNQQKRLFSRRLLTISSSPGIDYSQFLVENHHWDSVLITPYHSGTTSVNDLETGLLRFCERAQLAHTEVIFGPVRFGTPTYQSVEPLLRQGIKVLPAMSLPCAEALIRYLMGTQGNLAGLDSNMQLERIDI